MNRLDSGTVRPDGQEDLTDRDRLVLFLEGEWTALELFSDDELDVEESGHAEKSTVAGSSSAVPPRKGKKPTVASPSTEMKFIEDA